MITISSTDWTRQEAIKLSGLTISAFDYFGRMGIVKPRKVGSSRKPSVFYSWNQLLAIKFYSKAKKDFTPERMRQVLEYLNSAKPGDVLTDKRLLIFNDQIFWAEDTPKGVYQVITCDGQGKGKLILHLCVKDLIEEIRESARKNNIVDFQKRIEEAMTVFG